MAMLREWIHRLYYTLRRNAKDRELEEELKLHLDLTVEQMQRRGDSPDSARRAARLQEGGIVQAMEALRDQRGLPIVDVIAQDVRYALRQLRQNPAFSLVSIGSLALGIAATSLVFSVIQVVLLNPYPYQGADRVVLLLMSDPNTGRLGNPLRVTPSQFREFQQLEPIDDVVVASGSMMTRADGELPEIVNVGQMSTNAFDYFGVPPAVGRMFSQADGRPGEEPGRVVVLSYRYWQTRYGSSDAVVGQTVHLDGQDYEIVGVSPPGFTYLASDLYTPMPAGGTYPMLARLKTVISTTAAEAMLGAWVAQTLPPAPVPRKLRLVHVTDTSVMRSTATLVILLASATLLLTVGCANLSILLLARGTARQHEIAIRGAIGASRLRITGQLLVESLILGGVGGILGVLLAFYSLPQVSAWLPEGTFQLETQQRLELSTPVLVFSTIVTLLTALLFGLMPAIRMSRQRMGRLWQGTPRVAGDVHGRRTHRLLIACQVAITVLLVAGAGAALRVFTTLASTELGYEPRNVLIVDLPFTRGAYSACAERVAFFNNVRRRLLEAPGIASADYFGSSVIGPPIASIEASRQATGTQPSMIHWQPVGPHFFETLRIPLIRGRVWSDAEQANAAHITVINRVMADQFWPRGDAVGQRIRFLIPALAKESFCPGGPVQSDGWFEVIGVAGNTRNDGIAKPPTAAAYVPETLVKYGLARLAIRTNGDPLTAVQTVRQRVDVAAPNQGVTRVRTLEQLLRSEGWGKEQLVASVFLVFAALALLLAAVGLYSALSYAVAQRRREFGIRMALGATRVDVVLEVVRSAFTTVVAGLLLGLLVNAAASESLEQWLQISVRDPAVLVLTAAMLLGVSAAASACPAWRSVSTDPARALREE